MIEDTIQTYHQDVVALLTHIETIMSDDVWQKVDMKLWDKVAIVTERDLGVGQ